MADGRGGGRRLEPAPEVGSRSPFGRAFSADERRQLVLMAAAKRFETDGFHGTTMQEIADEVGITKAALYHYVDSKEQMLYEIHDAFISSILEEANQFVADNSDPAEQLRLFVHSIFRAVADFNPHVRAFFRDFTSLSVDSQADIKAKRDRYEKLVEDCLAEGVRQGRFELVVSPRLAGLFMFGACNWSYQWMRADRETPPHDLAEAWYTMLRKAYAPSSSDSATSSNGPA
jgi:AcrR family transcriptional regulator